MDISNDKLTTLCNITVGEYVLEGGVKSEREQAAFIAGVNTLAEKLRESSVESRFEIGDEVLYEKELFTIVNMSDDKGILSIKNDNDIRATVLAKDCDPYIPF